MQKATVRIYEVADSRGRIALRLNGRNGRILARFRDDMPGQTHRQWVRERRAVLDGYGDMCYDAIRLAMYRNGQSDFCPQIHAPELFEEEWRYIR